MKACRAGGRTPSDLPLPHPVAGRSRAAGAELSGARGHPAADAAAGEACCSLLRCTTRKGPDLYTVQLELELRGPLDAARLAASLQTIILHWHRDLRGLLRAGEGWSAGGWTGGAAACRGAAAAARYLSALDEAAQAERLREIAAQDRAERFAVEAAPLIRFALIKMSAQRHRALLSNYHLLMDGWSAPILVPGVALLPTWAGRQRSGSAFQRHAVPRLPSLAQSAWRRRTARRPSRRGGRRCRGLRKARTSLRTAGGGGRRGGGAAPGAR